MAEHLNRDDVPVAPADFSQGWATEDLVFTAGQVPMTATGDILLDEPVADQTRLCLENVEKILESAETGMEDVIKTTVFLDDLDDFEEMNAVYQEFFSPPMPARSVVEVAQVLKGADVKIEAIAERPADPN